MTEHPLILFDGVCNFCNASINFLIDRDRASRLRFAPLQSELGRKVLQDHLLPSTLDGVVLVEGGRATVKSTAALRATRYLDGSWPLMYAFIVVPRFLRDWVYDTIAANRYKWFGKTDACRVPTPELRERFLA